VHGATNDLFRFTITKGRLPSYCQVQTACTDTDPQYQKRSPLHSSLPLADHPSWACPICLERKAHSVLIGKHEYCFRNRNKQNVKYNGFFWDVNAVWIL
jgi:hypothetical protein